MPHTTCTQCHQALADLPDRPSVRQLAQLTAQVVQVPLCEMLSAGKKANAAYARALFTYMLHIEAGFSPAQIADMLRKAPSTITHRLNNIRCGLRQYAHIRHDAQTIKSRLNQPSS